MGNVAAVEERGPGHGMDGGRKDNWGSNLMPKLHTGLESLKDRSGNHGNNGNNGLPGHEGIKGDKGDKGHIGLRGERGTQGIQGEKGQAGIPTEFKVAFMASMATHFTNQNSGIIFSSVETNVGNHFDVMTGRFTVPVPGVYFFIFNMMKHEDVADTSVFLMHNGNAVITVYSSEAKGKHDSSGNSGVLKLSTGDEVWLRMGNGALYGDHQRFCTFSGFLLFELN
ncbi:complement C1q tumor necrosis factor-related protein 3 isoform X2 [Callorhinchus milii]|uniref:complement C1q tumor necrosis factor-related protein 3 isoform X2 n=1 Tax=Callorhinchus milii TaxID=7868 RepID=UPI001C3FBF1D|nr:complement C1q tumor necrosis factor-related protein 3 isoform X2 [Callorhinchus milii]